MRVDKQLASSHELVIVELRGSLIAQKSPENRNLSGKYKKIEFVVGKDLSQKIPFYHPNSRHSSSHHTYRHVLMLARQVPLVELSCQNIGTDGEGASCLWRRNKETRTVEKRGI